MPTYEYACRDCGRSLDVAQSFTDEALTECPTCGGSLRKVFGSVGISFKGSGFYKTDSRSSAGKAGGVKSEVAASTTSSSDGGSSDGGSSDKASSPSPATPGGGSAPSTPSSGSGDKTSSGSEAKSA